RQTFGLPNLQGRVPFHVGNGIALGEQGGETSHTLNISELPAHNHNLAGANVQADTASANGNTPSGNVVPAQGVAATISGNVAVTIYSNAAGSGAMNPAGMTPVGGNQPHDNLSPFLVLNFIIALQGIFPSQN